MMEIPFVDLTRQHLPILKDLTHLFEGAVRSSSFIMGGEVQAFEEAFAAYCETPYCIGVGNGTDALELILRAMGIGAGDEVITVPNTFIATAEAITACGARPVFCDIDPSTFNIDPKRVEERITANTRAIIPVHLYGQPADMKPLVDHARRHGLRVV